MSIDAKTARALHSAIRTVLMKEWDPIGISDVEGGEDEYDGYIPDLYRMIIRRSPIAEIERFLLWAEEEHMGLSANRQATAAIAQRLHALSRRSPEAA